ncbi:hypothetical protein DSM104443_01849 [Usitatibacter rugosus]|uniref:DUF1570 domain-containing protein n=1 Tax=Usitatibacter rugosus TaxID=2732067 RepID=A0A6M4GTZ6_9PROT|nr:hypothetical protein [Usitatibacter rugosus]QJR10780.1 hypothetical protein DSM104443_01849 [Usitatibacter rugosus]
MFGFLKGRRKEGPASDPQQVPDAAPAAAGHPGLEPFVYADHMDFNEGLPHVRWPDVHEWIAPLDEAGRNAAWEACNLGWLLHLRDALGEGYHVTRSPAALVMSSMPPADLKSVHGLVGLIAQRIPKVLVGIVEPPDDGREVLVVFDDQDTYYRYASMFDPEGGEYAFSSGRYIGGWASYFMTTRDDPHAVEPVIAHEMTHAFLSHLPLPLWLNEGLAVNTEARLSRPMGRQFTPQEMHAKHQRFWGPDEMQQLWSGTSFRRPDEGNMLSYDLARILVDKMSADWERFAAFALEADWSDGGAAAALKHYGIGLGQVASVLLEREPDPSFEPDPARWEQPAERAPERTAASIG